jgi:hypothetical protein
LRMVVIVRGSRVQACISRPASPPLHHDAGRSLK